MFFFAEKRLENIVIQEREKFLLYTNFDNLGPILLKKQLVNAEELEKLTNSQQPPKDRATHFYGTVLRSKGSAAYRLLRESLEEEDKHRGHKDLWHMLSQKTHA